MASAIPGASAPEGLVLHVFRAKGLPHKAPHAPQGAYMSGPSEADRKLASRAKRPSLTHEIFTEKRTRTRASLQDHMAKSKKATYVNSLSQGTSYST